MINYNSIKLVQMKVLAGQVEKNALFMLSEIEKSRTESVKTLIFPACALTGAELGSCIYQRDFWEEVEYWRAQIVAASIDQTVIWGDAHADDFQFIEFPIIAGNGNALSSTDSIWKMEDRATMQVLLSDQKASEKIADLTLRLAHNPYRKTEEFSPQEESQNFANYIYVNSVGVENTGSIVNILVGGSGYKKAGEKFVQTAPYFEASSTSIHTSIPVEEPSPVEKLYHSLHYSAKYFLEQIGVSKIIIGLSGGIDSAISACIYRSVLEPENIILVNMPSRFNSNTTKNISAHLAAGLETWYGVMSIEDALSSTVSQFNDTYFNRPNSEPLHLALSGLNIENLQARIRSNRILATLSSSFGGVFTCNGNKSEIIVGYGTLYGDDAGFFALLGDLWKTEIYELARYLKTLPLFANAIPDEIFTTPPSAELSEKQAVEEGLGDPIKYDYHDRVFSAFMETMPNATPLTILRWYQKGTLEKNLNLPPNTVSAIFSTPKEFIEDMEYWWRQYSGLSVAKRTQGAPILALSNRAFGSFPESQIPWRPGKIYAELRKSLIE